MVAYKQHFKLLVVHSLIYLFFFAFLLFQTVWTLGNKSLYMFTCDSVYFYHYLFELDQINDFSC